MARTAIERLAEKTAERQFFYEPDHAEALELKERWSSSRPGRSRRGNTARKRS